MNLDTQYSAYLESAASKITAGILAHTPFMLDAQIAYVAATSEWRQLASVRKIILRHGSKATCDALEKRLTDLRAAHAMEMQTLFSLNVTSENVGHVPLSPFAPDLSKHLSTAYMSGVYGGSHEFGLVANSAIIRDKMEATMPVCSLIPLAVSHLTTLARQFEMLAQNTADLEDAELDVDSMDILHRDLMVWSGVAIVAPDDYPKLGGSIISDELPSDISETIIEYIGCNEIVAEYTFGSAVRAALEINEEVVVH